MTHENGADVFHSLINHVVCSGLQAEKVHELNEEIGKLLAKAEQLGAEGNVDEAQKVLQEVEKVRTRKKDAEVRTEALVSTLILRFLTLCLVLTWSVSESLSSGGVQELHAGLQLPAAEAQSVRGVLRLPGSP